MTTPRYQWQNKHPEWSDEQLIAMYISSEDAIYVAELFGRYADMIFGVCLKHLKDEQESEDASCELFEQLISKLKAQQIQHFKPWMYRTTCNYCIDKLRKGTSTKIVSLEDRFETTKGIFDLVTDHHEKEAMLSRIDYCLSTLNEDQRMCIDLFYLKERTYQDISEQLNISWSATRSYIQNGKRNLKICMEKHDDRRV